MQGEKETRKRKAREELHDTQMTQGGSNEDTHRERGGERKSEYNE